MSETTSQTQSSSNNIHIEKGKEDELLETREIISPLIALLSSGTTHKPHLRDSNDFIVTEAEASALYLLQHYPSTPISCLIEENVSLDTIGNAFFLRTLHTDYLMLDSDISSIHLHVITNSFHMLRTKVIFEFVFGLPHSTLKFALREASSSSSSSLSSVSSHIKATPPYNITFIEVPNNGLDPDVLSARLQKEEESTIAFENNMSKNSIDSLNKLRNWMYSEHMAYSSKRLSRKVKMSGSIDNKEEERDSPSMKKSLLNSY